MRIRIGGGGGGGLIERGGPIREGGLNRGFRVLPNSYISCICFIFSHLAMDLFIGLFCLFIFVCFVSVLAISFLLRHVSVLQWQLDVTSGMRDHALQGWQRAAEELGATSGARDPNVQMDASGRFIPIDQRRYLLEGTRNDHIVDVPTGKQAVDHIFLPSEQYAENVIVRKRLDCFLLSHLD